MATEGFVPDGLMSLDLNSDGKLYLTIGDQQLPILEATTLRPQPGGRICRTADGAMVIVFGSRVPPAGSVVVREIRDHLVLLKTASGVYYLDTTKDTARFMLLHAHPDTVMPGRRLTPEEVANKVNIGLEPLLERLCSHTHCSRPVVDGCSCCERPLCSEHVVLHIAVVGIALGYCDSCSYFLG